MSKKKKKRRKKYRVFWFFAKLQFFIIGLGILGIALFYGSGYGKKIENLYREAKAKVAASSEDTFKASQTSLVYDSSGNLLSALKGEKDVYYLEIDSIPYDVKTAFISTEDKKFYSHHGIDLKGIMRAVKAIITDRKISQGGSTITQQLARNVYLSYEKTWERKVEEMFIAMELEKLYDKSEILEFYINNIYFANGYYGIQAASKGYFNRDVKELSLSQMVFLCAIPNNPSLYDPVVNMENTIKRRDRMLLAMKENGKITEEEYESAISEEIVLERPETTKNNYVETYIFYSATRKLMEAKGFVFQYKFEDEAARAEYDEAYHAMYEECQKSLYTGGYRIYTSIDLSLQAKLQTAVDEGLAEFTETNEEGIYTLQGAAACIDNTTGRVVAIVGGREQNLPGYTLNRAYQSFRQPGSAIKPLIVYTPILEKGEYTPSSIVKDEKTEEGPKNSDNNYEGDISLRKAVTASKNTVAWNLFQELSPKTGLSYLEKMNFSKIEEGDYVLSTALGGFTTGVSPVEMASGYATLANDGDYREPNCIVKILDADGEVLVGETQEEISVYKENAARMMTDILKDVITEGTGKGLAIDGIALAGKTGTTNDNKDGWFVGYSYYYTTSVWVGYDLPKKMKGLSGASYPGKIWKNFMAAAHEGKEYRDFVSYVNYDEQDEIKKAEEGEGASEGGNIPAEGSGSSENQKPTTPKPTEPKTTEPKATEPQATEPQATEPSSTVPADNVPETEGGGGETEDTTPEPPSQPEPPQVPAEPARPSEGEDQDGGANGEAAPGVVQN